MSAAALLRARLTACPIVAILRGIMPGEIDAVGDALMTAGIVIIEVPLNSPDPFASIDRLAKRYGAHALVGAGTVLSIGEVGRVQDHGGQLIVSPDANSAVIAASAAAGLVALPGYFTASEGFAALRAGAHGLKLFPAEGVPPAYLKAQRAVLPHDVPVLAVGGVTVDNLGGWRAAGADGYGIGSALYKPGKSSADVARDARAFVAASQA